MNRNLFQILISAVFFVFAGKNIAFSQTVALADRITKVSIKTERRTVYSSMEQLYGDQLPGVQIARWHNGYVVAYTPTDMNSRYFFIDHDFKKSSMEYRIAGKVVYQIVTDNGEIAMLTGSSEVDDDGDVDISKLNFTEVNEAGQVLKNVPIVGSKDIQKPGASIPDNVGNPTMKWTGRFYVAFLPISHNFKTNDSDPDDIHQGDCAYIIEPGGKLYSFIDWNVSHSFEQRVLITNQYTVLMSKGDAGPRGLEVDYYPMNNYEIGPLDKDEQDQNRPALTQKFIHNEADEHLCKAFTVSGEKGENYLPFSLGDPVLLDEHRFLLSYSYTEGKPTHDIAITTINPKGENCSSGHLFLTNTPEICEHSVHSASLENDQILVFWKAFDIKKFESDLVELHKIYEDEEDEEETIFIRNNPDRNMMAIINKKGEFIVQPEEVDKSDADWYYNITLKDSSTPWHDIMDGYANHTQGSIIKTHEGKTLWTHHAHRSKVVDLYIVDQEKKKDEE